MADDYTDFDAQASEITRRRTLAAMLQKQGMGGAAPPARGVMHWTQTLGPAMAALIGGISANQTDTQEKELSGKRQAALEQLLNNPPQGAPAYPATSSAESSVGVSGPVQLGSGEGVAFPAGAAKPPAAADEFRYAMNVGRTMGGDEGRDVVKAAAAKILPRTLGIASKPPTLHEYYNDAGQKTYGYLGDDGKTMIQVGGAETKQPRNPPELEQRLNLARSYTKATFPNASPEEQERLAQQTALRDISVTPDATGGVTTTSKVAAGANMGGPAPAARAPLVPSANPQDVVARASAANSPKPTQKVDIAGTLQQELTDNQARLAAATIDEDRRLATNNINEINKEMARQGVKAAAPAPQQTGFSLEPDRVEAYRKDARNGPYLPPQGTPGVSMTTGTNTHMVRLNTDTAKLADDMTKQKIPELNGAIANFDNTMQQLAADPKSGVKLDANGQPTGKIPGFGGTRGLANIFPIAATEQGQQVRAALAPVVNIILQQRSGAAVTDTELKRYKEEMATSFGNNDAQFYRSYAAFKERLAALEHGVTGGYAPIVVDAYRSGSGAPSSRAAAPKAPAGDSDAKSRYEARMKALESE